MSTASFCPHGHVDHFERCLDSGTSRMRSRSSIHKADAGKVLDQVRMAYVLQRSRGYLSTLGHASGLFSRKRKAILGRNRIGAAVGWCNAAHPRRKRSRCSGCTVLLHMPGHTWLPAFINREHRILIFWSFFAECITSPRCSISVRQTARCH